MKTDDDLRNVKSGDNEFVRPFRIDTAELKGGNCSWGKWKCENATRSKDAHPVFIHTYRSTQVDTTRLVNMAWADVVKTRKNQEWKHIRTLKFNDQKEEKVSTTPSGSALPGPMDMNELPTNNTVNRLEKMDFLLCFCLRLFLDIARHLLDDVVPCEIPNYGQYIHISQSVHTQPLRYL